MKLFFLLRCSLGNFYHCFIFYAFVGRLSSLAWLWNIILCRNWYMPSFIFEIYFWICLAYSNIIRLISIHSYSFIWWKFGKHEDSCFHLEPSSLLLYVLSFFFLKFSSWGLVWGFYYHIIIVGVWWYDFKFLWNLLLNFNICSQVIIFLLPWFHPCLWFLFWMIIWKRKIYLFSQYLVWDFSSDHHVDIYLFSGDSPSLTGLIIWNGGQRRGF